MQVAGKEIGKAKLLWILFKSTFTLSAFTIGGGYVIVPLMSKLFVEKYQWIEEREMLDLVAIGQGAPGAIAVNTSILVGYKIAGVVGAFATLFGTILPPLISLTIISYLYDAIRDNQTIKTLFFGMSIGVAIVILDAIVSMGKKIFTDRKIIPILIMFVAFAVAYFTNVNIVFVILGGAVIGLISSTLQRGEK